MLDESQLPTGATLAELQRELEAARAKVVQLEAAVEAHGRIGQAMGVLMARYGIGPDPAFAALARVSQRHNLKLRRLADAVICATTGEDTALPRELLDALEELLRAGEGPSSVDGPAG
jgi:AmiR/NasT family two-component response regulator